MILSLSRRSVLPTLFLSLVICLLSGIASKSTNTKLSEFAEITKVEAEGLVPGFPSSFPDARFYLTGMQAPSGNWHFIRIEEKTACEGSICPTIIKHDNNGWRVLVKVEKNITSSINLENGEYIQFNLSGKIGHEIVLRYKVGEYMLYVDNNQ